MILCPNPNNLEPHYLWFSCLLRCVENKDEKLPKFKGKIVKYKGINLHISEELLEEDEK